MRARRRADDAAIVQNPSLREVVRGARARVLPSLLDAKRELARTRDLSFSPIGSSARRGRFGRLVSPHVYELELASHPYLAGLAAGFGRCLDGYALRDFELWIGDGEPTAPHNDAGFYLGTGQAVGLQFWLLLEATPLDAPGEGEDVERDKNALECLLPAAPGVLWPEMPAVLTPAGWVHHRPRRVVGGDDLGIGDLLVFKSGVIHSAQGNAAVFRAALAFRAVLAADAHDRDVDLLCWFRDACAADASLRDRLRDDPDFKSARASWSRLGARACDRSKLAKIDRHDHGAVRRRLGAFDFRPFGHGDVAVWAPITEWP